MSPPTKRRYVFGPFRLDVGERELSRGGIPVRLPVKVIDTLIVLVESHGHIVQKDDLMARIWPDTAVEENSLNKTVSAIRKALGEDDSGQAYIETMPKRGYRFVAPVSEPRDAEVAESPQGSRTMPRTLAVLPFKMLGPDPSDEYLGVGMADTLITRLSNMREVVVRPTSAVLKYQSAAPDPVTAGRQLRVAAVLEGSIRRTTDRIRVTVQLVSTETGAPLWAEKFDEPLNDLFVVEDRVCERAASALVSRITREERVVLTRHPTESIEAHELYLRGRYHAAKYTPEGLGKASECFRQALAIDPDYALAYEGLAYYYFVSSNEFSLPPREAMPQTRAAARAALARDDGLGEAHMYLAAVHFWYDWDWPAAEKEFERAIARSPNNALIHVYYGVALTWMGRFDRGVAECRRATEIQPLSPEAMTNLGSCHFFAGHFEEAIAHHLQAIEVDPQYWFAHLQLGRACEQAGRLNEAITALRAAWRLQDAYPEVLAALARAHAVAGQVAEARALLEQLGDDDSRARHLPPYHVAIVHAALGEADEAFVWLEKALAERSFFMTWLRTDPALANLRADQRFADLQRRVGLPE